MAFTSLSNWILHVVVWLEKYLLLDKRNWPLKKKRPLSLRTINQRKYVLSTALLRSYECFLLLRATRGAHNPNVKVVITHASHVGSQLSVWTSTKNEWNAQNTLWSCAFGPSITRNLITRVLTICHVKRTQSTALEQNLRSLSPALHNLWLLLVITLKFLCYLYSEVSLTIFQELQNIALW